MDREKRVREKVMEIAEEVALQEGLEVVDVEVGGAPGKYMVRVYIDREGGVTMKDCVDFSRVLGTVLDVEDPIPTSYVLEVSSPGVNRVLRKPEHFTRFMGHDVVISLASPVEGRRKVRGKIEDVAEMGVVVRNESGTFFVEFENVRKANLRVIE